jgi:hypothetical protein
MLEPRLQDRSSHEVTLPLGIAEVGLGRLLGNRERRLIARQRRRRAPPAHAARRRSCYARPIGRARCYCQRPLMPRGRHPLPRRVSPGLCSLNKRIISKARVELAFNSVPGLVPVDLACSLHGVAGVGGNFPNPHSDFNHIFEHCRIRRCLIDSIQSVSDPDKETCQCASILIPVERSFDLCSPQNMVDR